MKNDIFESHILADKDIPFIYNNNVICDSIDVFANWHENIEILYFCEGEGEVVVNDEVFPLKAPCVFVVNSGYQHRIGSVTKIRYSYLIPDLSFCEENGIPTDRLIYENMIKDDHLFHLFDKIEREYTDNGEFGAAAIRCAVLETLVYLSRNYVIQKKEYPGSEDSIKLAISYMRSHYKERISIGRLSDEAGLSRYYFSRLFKRVTGETPVNYLNNLRCESAKKMRRKSNYSIGEIAVLNGFETVSYFSKVFKKYSGMLPSRYKNMKF